MASSNDVERSGSLYGPNFVEWKERMMAILRLQDLDLHIIEGDGQSRRSGSIAYFIRMHVNPEIVKRVPIHELSNARLLMQRLESISTSFRFLDLPAELRNEIYKFVLGDCDRHKLRDQRTVPQPKVSFGYPPITKISRQIRAEALPIFYASSVFIFDSDKTGMQVATTLQRWMAEVAGEQVRHLTSVSVGLEIKYSGTTHQVMKGEVQFTYTAKTGLRVRYPDNLTASSKTKLDELIGSTEKLAKVFGTPNDGRTMLLDIISSPNLWKSETLRVSRKGTVH